MSCGVTLPANILTDIWRRRSWNTGWCCQSVSDWSRSAASAVSVPETTQLLQSSHFLPDIGAGVRFTVSKKYHVNMRADYGQGANGHTFGLGVLEAF